MKRLLAIVALYCALRGDLLAAKPNVLFNAVKNQQSHALVEFVDIYPTLCELVSLPVPQDLEGKRLVPLLTDPAAKVNDAAFSQFPRKDEGRDYMGCAMRTAHYRYIEWLDQKSGSIAARELYDHENDKEESENIASRPENTALLANLNAQMWRTLPRPRFAGGEEPRKPRDRSARTVIR